MMHTGGVPLSSGSPARRLTEPSLSTSHNVGAVNMQDLGGGLEESHATRGQQAHSFISTRSE
jgi:hypothetical protein